MYKIEKDTVSKVTLPWPPSVNHYWGQRVLGKRVMKFILKRGKDFRQDVIDIIKPDVEAFKELYCKPHRLAVTVLVYSPDRRRRDIDNLMKATLDALEHAGMYDDDCQIDSLHILRNTEEIRKNGEIEFIIGRIEGQVNFKDNEA